ncbi:MAG: triose-phosphate isomerase [Myxococcales bacterium]|nr:triose-phosphate isomerase [Myxococcales bacterium]
MSRRYVIGGNWKMNLTLPEAQELGSGLRNRLGSHRGAEAIVYPSFPYLQTMVKRFDDSRVAVGAQDLHTEQSGAYTSGVSVQMLTSIGVTHVLIGHSERRAVFGDSDEIVAQKLSVALANGLIPTLCIGETREERHSNETFSVLERQLNSALRGHTPQALSKLILAYEPVWAIGTGLTASPAQAQEVHAWVRGYVGSLLGSSFASQVPIQYGGSVKPANAAGLLSQPDIDGALVGGASLKAPSFADIIKSAH